MRLRGVGRRVRGWLGRTSCRISKSGDGAGLGRHAEFRLQKYKSSVAAKRTELSCFQGSVETGRRARDFATVAVTKVWCAEYGALWLEPHEPKRTVLFPAAFFELRLGLHPITPTAGVLGTPACGSMVPREAPGFTARLKSWPDTRSLPRQQQA